MCKDEAKPKGRPPRQYDWVPAGEAGASEELVAVSCQCRGPRCSEACTCAQNGVRCSAACHKTFSSTTDCGRRKTTDFNVRSQVPKKDYRHPERRKKRATSRLQKNKHRRRGESAFRRPPELPPEPTRTESQQRMIDDLEDELQRPEEEDSTQYTAPRHERSPTTRVTLRGPAGSVPGATSGRVEPSMVSTHQRSGQRRQLIFIHPDHRLPPIRDRTRKPTPGTAGLQPALISPPSKAPTACCLDS